MATRMLDLLPALYREDPFAGQYLQAFERLLLGSDDPGMVPDVGTAALQPALEKRIDQLADTFDAFKTPKDFLPWLASWVALSLRADLDEAGQRKFLANVVQRYRLRGTLRNMVDLLGMFTIGTPTVTEDAQPHSFSVNIFLPAVNSAARQAQVDQQLKIAYALIELEKPAHTVYTLTVSYPSMQIGKTSHVGTDTILGVATY